MQRNQDQRSRSAKPTTVHGCAQSCDVLGFQKFLRENPSLLNDRNPIMVHAPLHVSAGHNNVGLVKFLLDGQGPEKVELEAKNMDGMTTRNHLSQGPGSEKLRELLHWHLEEQRKRKAIEACSETKAKMDEREGALSNVVGLHELKLQLQKWAKGMLLDER